MANGNDKFVPEIKGSLLIKHDRPILDKNISSDKLFLSEKNCFLIVFYTVMSFSYNIWLFSHGFMNIVILVKMNCKRLKSSSLIISTVHSKRKNIDK